MFKLKINSLKKQQHPIQCRFQFQFVLVFIIQMKDFCSEWSLDLIVSNVRQPLHNHKLKKFFFDNDINFCFFKIYINI